MTTLFAADFASSTDKQPDTRATSEVLSSLIQEFNKEQELLQKKSSGGAETTLKVSDVLGNVAFLYERIRNVIEYKGEYVLRRNAIERILKRLLWENPVHNTERIAHTLLRELIWARYFPNDSLPKHTVNKIAKIISKYLYLLESLLKLNRLPKNQLKEWVWGVASCEIEEALDPSQREPYVILMYHWVRTFFKWQDPHITEHEKDIQIYIAIHRSLAKSDDEILRFHLLVHEYPQWLEADQRMVDQTISRFDLLYKEISAHLTFPDRFLLYRQIQRHIAPFNILKEIVDEEKHEFKKIISDKALFTQKVKDMCEKKYKEIQKKVNRGIVRSIIYIFVTKVLIALLLEIPYELYRFGALTMIPIGINIVFPPAMMWLIGLTIKAPGSKNTERILTKLHTVVYQEDSVTQSQISVMKSKGSFLQTIFTFIYGVLFLLIFGLISWILVQLHFTFLGTFVFFAFLSLVLLFGFRVRFTAQELKVTGERQGILSYMFDNLTLPFLRTGVWLSKGLAKINFLTAIFDFLIEAPLKTIIEVFEEWTSFIREKRDEVVEVPEQ